METNGQKKRPRHFIQIGHLLLHVLAITAHQAVKFYFPKLQQRLNSSSRLGNSDLVRASAKTSAPRMTTMLLASFSGCPNLKICSVAGVPFRHLGVCCYLAVIRSPTQAMHHYRKGKSFKIYRRFASCCIVSPPPKNLVL